MSSDFEFTRSPKEQISILDKAIKQITERELEVGDILHQCIRRTNYKKGLNLKGVIRCTTMLDELTDFKLTVPGVFNEKLLLDRIKKYVSAFNIKYIEKTEDNTKKVELYCRITSDLSLQFGKIYIVYIKVEYTLDDGFAINPQFSVVVVEKDASEGDND